MRQIKKITTYAECDSFVHSFFGDKQYSDPMLYSEENLDSMLITPINTPERHLVIGVCDNDRMTSLFSFLAIQNEGYLEMLAKALAENKPNGMMLLVDVDNTPAIRLYDSMGFTVEPGRNYITSSMVL